MDSLISWGVAVGLYMMLALSLNAISGYAGQLSFGQAAFAGLGAYTSALLTVRGGVSFWLACPASSLAVGLVGLGLGLPVLRGGRHYVPIMTLVLSTLTYQGLGMGRWVGPAIGGGRIPAPSWFGVSFSPAMYLTLVAVGLAACVAGDRGFRASRWGQRLAQTDPVAAGQKCAPAVLAALGLGAAMAGLAGSLLAHFSRFITPFDFDVEASLFVVTLAVFGGLGSVRGVLLGAVVLSGVFEAVPALAPYRLLTSGLLLLGLGMWRPQGFFASADGVKR